MYSDAPFCPIQFSFTLRDGLRTFTYRSEKSRVDTKGVLVNTIQCFDDSRHFNAVMISTDMIRSTT